MRGSVKKDGSGRWMYAFDVPTIDGKRKQIRRRGFATKKAAEDDMRDRIAEAKGGTLVKPTRLTVGQFLINTWLPSIASRVRPTTLDSYTRHTTTRLVPALGDVELQALDEAAVSRWICELGASGLAPKTIRNYHGTLSRALSDAHRTRLVNRNVARGAELPAMPRRKFRAWDSAQMKRFLAHVETDRLAPLWRLLATTGMRRGEALGLRWSDVDLKAQTVTITNQRTIAGGRIVEGEPKSAAGNRTMKLDARTTAALKSWRTTQNEERLLMGAGWDAGDYVFTHPTGEPLWPQTITAQFKRHAEALALPAIGVHGLRHSAATWMIASGVSPKVVTHRLGHAHVSITLQLYSHVLPAHDQEAVDAFAQALDG